MAPAVLNEQILLERLNAFKPEPLVSLPDEQISASPIEIPAVQEDENTIDLGRTNFLNLINHKEIEQVAEKTIREYGVGTCGPRAFYGTTDVHLELEERLAEFLGVEESIIYSYGFVAISSSIAAYCKRTDLVFIDEHANFPTEQGLQAAKSRTVRFQHNSAQSFRDALLNTAESDKKKRKFLILEGVSWRTGKVCDLIEFLRVAEEHKVRVFLDESYSLGVFGKTGRGLTEHFSVDPTRIDMLFGTLEGAIGSIGGFCAGSNLIIEHQRLSGSGYIFSASLPTYLVKVVVKALQILGDKPQEFMKFSKSFHGFLVECGFCVESDPESPFKVVKSEKCELVYDQLKSNGVHVIKHENLLVINLNLGLFSEEKRLEKVYQVFRAAAAAELQ